MEKRSMYNIVVYMRMSRDMAIRESGCFDKDPNKNQSLFS